MHYVSYFSRLKQINYLPYAVAGQIVLGKLNL